MSCVSCEMICVKELGWSSVREHESSSTKCHTKAALEWVELWRWLEWDELCEMSCVNCEMRGVVWVVTWAELCETSSVSCEMSGVVWDELCELWDAWSCVSCEMSCVKELGWSSVREHESSSSKCHTKAALGWVELCEMSCERWVVSDKLCDLWDERSCVKWVVLAVRWAEIREMSCVSCEMSGVV